MQAAPLTDQQSEVRAVGASRAMRHQAVPRCEGNQGFGIVEELEVEPRLGQHFGGIKAHAPKDLRNVLRAADAHCCVLAADADCPRSRRA